MLSSLALECVVRVSVGHGALGSWGALLIILLTRLSGISWRAPARRLCAFGAVSMFSNNRFVKRESSLVLTLIRCFLWGTSVMTHLFMAH